MRTPYGQRFILVYPVVYPKANPLTGTLVPVASNPSVASPPLNGATGAANPITMAQYGQPLRWPCFVADG